jgi:predicted secreted protein
MNTSKKGLTGGLRGSAPVAVAGLALAACGSSGAKTVALTQTDNGRTVALKTGDMLRITLPENLTTPYAWKFTAEPSAQVMALTSSKYVATPVAPDVVGSGGHQIYTFKVHKAASTSIALALSYVGRTPKVVQRFAVNVKPG